MNTFLILDITVANFWDLLLEELLVYIIFPSV